MESLNAENSLFKMDAPSLEQLKAISKWSKFIGIVFSIFTITVFLTCLFILLNYESIIDEMASVNGISDEMIFMMTNLKKIHLIIFMVLCTTVLFLNGYFLLGFGIFSSSTNKFSLTKSFNYLNRYFILSIILSVFFLLLGLLVTAFVFWIYATS